MDGSSRDKSEKKAKKARYDAEEEVAKHSKPSKHEDSEAELGADDEEETRRKAEKAAKKAAKKAKREAERADGGAGKAASDEEGDDDAGKASGRKRKRSEMDTSNSGAGEEKGADAGASWGTYKPSAEVKAMSASEVSAFRSERNIAVEDEYSTTEWKPIPKFEYAAKHFTPEVMACTKSFATPSPIQSQSWPILLSARDIVGIAATGSGKTLAFMLPAFMHILSRRAASGSGSGAGATAGKAGPVVLVLAPTRELAMQTAKVSSDGGASCGINSSCIYGGVPKDIQRKELKAGGGAEVVIATPGRLLDLIEEGALKLSNVTYLVLDEADRMLDMGFEKDIRAIIGMLPKRAGGRQTIMFSATWPPAIQAIAAEFLSKPVKVMIGSAELAASSSITQIVEVVEEPRDRDGILLKLLSKYHASRKNRVLVFVLYKKEAARTETFLQGRGWNCCAIHGDMSQEARTRSFNNFRDGKIPLLIATDVAARGLDIPNVEYVINYSFPLTIEDYVHRIGRTGRGGKTGIAHTLFTPLDKAHAGELVNVLREAGVEPPSELLKFGTHVKKKEHSLYGAHFKADAVPSEKKHMTFD